MNGCTRRMRITESGAVVVAAVAVAVAAAAGVGGKRPGRNSRPDGGPERRDGDDGARQRPWRRRLPPPDGTDADRAVGPSTRPEMTLRCWTTCQTTRWWRCRDKQRILQSAPDGFQRRPCRQRRTSSSGQLLRNRPSFTKKPHVFFFFLLLLLCMRWPSSIVNSGEEVSSWSGGGGGGGREAANHRFRPGHSSDTYYCAPVRRPDACQASLRREGGMRSQTVCYDPLDGLTMLDAQRM